MLIFSLFHIWSSLKWILIYLSFILRYLYSLRCFKTSLQVHRSISSLIYDLHKCSDSCVHFLCYDTFGNETGDKDKLMGLERWQSRKYKTGSLSAIPSTTYHWVFQGTTPEAKPKQNQKKRISWRWQRCGSVVDHSLLLWLIDHKPYMHEVPAPPPSNTDALWDAITISFLPWSSSSFSLYS